MADEIKSGPKKGDPLNYPPGETIPGGAYIVGGTVKNANGDPCDGKDGRPNLAIKDGVIVYA